nr:hypothetical protein [Tanacetum cinerariifolium]
CDKLALVDDFTLVEENIGLLETRVIATNLSVELLMLGQVLMINWLGIVETDKVNHIVETDIVKLVVEIESFGMSFDDFDKETRSSDGLQPKQNSLNSSDPSPSCRPTKVKVRKELPKVSMVNTSLKKLKHYLAGFDVFFKERTMATAITKDELRKLKGKALVDNVVTTHTIALEMLNFDVEPLALRLLKNRTANSDCPRLTQEQAMIYKEVVEQGKS